MTLDPPQSYLRALVDLRVGVNSRGRTHEADLSAKSYPPPAGSRIPGANEDAWGPRRPQAPPREGSIQARGYHTLEVGVAEQVRRLARRTGRFTRADRLLQSGEFQHVTRQGQRAASTAYVVLVVSDGAWQQPRLGLTVSRKVGNAVVRNRVKRRVREWFRLERGRLTAGTEVVVIARREASRLSFEEGKRMLSVLVEKAVRV